MILLGYCWKCVCVCVCVYAYMSDLGKDWHGGGGGGQSFIRPVSRVWIVGRWKEQQRTELFLGQYLCLPDSRCMLTHTHALTRKRILKSAPSSVARSTPGDPTACGQNGGATSGGSAGPVLRHPEGWWVERRGRGASLEARYRNVSCWGSSWSRE